MSILTLRCIAMQLSEANHSSENVINYTIRPQQTNSVSIQLNLFNSKYQSPCIDSFVCSILGKVYYLLPIC